MFKKIKEVNVGLDKISSGTYQALYSQVYFWHNQNTVFSAHEIVFDVCDAVFP